MLDFLNHDLRVALAEELRDPVIRSNLERLNALKFSEYSFETESTLNRLQRFLRNELFAAVFGQTHVSLDLSAACTAISRSPSARTTSRLRLVDIVATLAGFHLAPRVFSRSGG
ncbi:MAG: hypothetical protein ACREX4_13085 [Gammaproteobacteria bacterium]